MLVVFGLTLQPQNPSRLKIPDIVWANRFAAAVGSQADTGFVSITSAACKPSLGEEINSLPGYSVRMYFSLYRLNSLRPMNTERILLPHQQSRVSVRLQVMRSSCTICPSLRLQSGNFRVCGQSQAEEWVIRKGSKCNKQQKLTFNLHVRDESVLKERQPDLFSSALWAVSSLTQLSEQIHAAEGNWKQMRDDPGGKKELLEVQD